MSGIITVHIQSELRQGKDILCILICINLISVGVEHFDYFVEPKNLLKLSEKRKRYIFSESFLYEDYNAQLLLKLFYISVDST